MHLALKIVLCATALGAGALEQVKGPPTSAASSVIVSTPLKCEESCEIRFPDGDCKVDMVCLMRSALGFPSTPAFSIASSEAVGGEEHADGNILEEDKEPGSSPSSCRGRCLFLDKEDNCRLDFICTLGRDVEGTLRFLRELNVDAETAILLALSASSNAKGATDDDDDDLARRCDMYRKPVLVPCDDDSCENRNEEEEEEEDSGSESTAGTASVTDPPDNDCPGKCEYRDPNGVCITNYDCAHTDP